jgi:hypothetical protein
MFPHLSPSSRVGRLMNAHKAYVHDHKLEEIAGIEIALTLIVVLTIVVLMANGWLTR